MTAVLLLCASLVVAPPDTRRGPAFSNADARAHFDAAVGHFAEQDWASASDELGLAYELEAVAELLYARAQAERKLERWASAASLYADYLATDPPRDQADNARAPLLFCRAKAEQAAGRCAEARPMFESYLQVYPSAADAELAHAALEACAAEPEPAPAAAPVEPVADPLGPASPEGDVRRPADTPWHRDLAGGILVGSGLTVAAAGTSVALAGRAAFAGGQVAEGHQDAVDAMDRGVVLERVGIGVAAAGGVIVLAGVARWITVGTRPRRSRRTSRLVPTGLGLSWVARW